MPSLALFHWSNASTEDLRPTTHGPGGARASHPCPDTTLLSKRGRTSTVRWPEQGLIGSGGDPRTSQSRHFKSAPAQGPGPQASLDAFKTWPAAAPPDWSRGDSCVVST
eukprot:scaffold870_cov268-Pinguiococcus_pyrenoidosus.AAC.100